MLLKNLSTVVQWRANVEKNFTNVDVIFAQYFKVRTYTNLAYAYLHAFRREVLETAIFSTDGSSSLYRDVGILIVVFHFGGLV